MKICVNKCYGGFDLSVRAILRYAELEGFKLFCYTNKEQPNGILDFSQYVKIDPEKYGQMHIVHWIKEDLGDAISDKQLNAGNYFSERDINRNDPSLCQAVEELGKAASGRYGDIRIVEIPDDIEWEIDEYDGIETIHERHRSW